jgi:hypothetical protein
MAAFRVTLVSRCYSKVMESGAGVDARQVSIISNISLRKYRFDHLTHADFD